MSRLDSKVMGGPGSGGKRSGAGAKPKLSHLRGIDGGAGRRGAAGAPPPPDDAPPVDPAPAVVEPPSTLGESARAIWDELGPQALAAGTLTATTRHNFAELCQLTVECRELHRRFQPQVDAHGVPRALVCMSAKEEMATRREYRNLSKEIHLRMKDFRLAPFGKELAPAACGAREADPMDGFSRMG